MAALIRGRARQGKARSDHLGWVPTVFGLVSSAPLQAMLPRLTLVWCYVLEACYGTGNQRIQCQDRR